MKIFHKPTIITVIVDVLLLSFSFFVVLKWFPLTTNTPFTKYSLPSLFYVITWILCSYLFQRYRPLKRQGFFVTALKLVGTSVVVSLFYLVLIQLYFNNQFSEYVLFAVSIIVFAINYVALNIYFAYRFAVEYKDIVLASEENRVNAKAKEAVPLDKESWIDLCATIQDHSGKRVFQFLNENLTLADGNTYVYATTDPLVLKFQPHYQYSTIIQLEKLNNILGINKMLSIANEKLPDDGVFICCYESKSTYKKEVLNRYNKGFNYIFYVFNFVVKRIIPKIFLSQWLYFYFTGGRNRVLSKAEVLGRVYSCGFKVLREKKIGHLTYVFAKRVKQPEMLLNKTYGPLIRLHRYGKNGEPFDVYKMRTMHPYSEFLQTYIYERNSLKDGGKFYKDFRVTTMGRIMRRFWIDELPTIYNLMNGDIKLVGVRPLSVQYFNLYDKELQEKRIAYKPGLLPPFYADMPNTLSEIQESELKYLNACEKQGTFITDVRYFFLILQNILIKKARSA